MRVLGAVLEKIRMRISLSKVITALDYPMITDRNKALYSLLSLYNRVMPVILTHAQTQLMDELKHYSQYYGFAYEILKKSVGKILLSVIIIHGKSGLKSVN